MVDRSAWTSARGLRAVKISTAGLALTTVVQLAVVGVGGSVALLADGLHNFGDVFTTVGLWIAFVASRRAADRRYTFGYDRFEDLTGIVIVVLIVLSAALAGYESVRALAHPREVGALGVSMAAALVGLAGNEIVGRYKIRVGRQIRSVGLEADGMHSRVDGLASLGAFLGLLGVRLGYPRMDAIAGLVITVVIVWIAIGTGRDVVARLVDRVDPHIVEHIEGRAATVTGVMDVHEVRARWAGRSLYVQLHIAVGEELPLHEAHTIGEEVRHVVLHEIEGVSQVLVHIDPWGGHESVYHAATAHHFHGAGEPPHPPG